MLQTRAGRCPNCKEETLPGAEICSACGTRLGWESNARVASGARQSTPARSGREVAAPRAATASPPYLRWFVLFISGCAIIMAALSFRSSSTRDSDAPPNLQANHATLVQDAEAFRDKIKSLAGTPDAPEANLVIGVALPNRTELLEITVRNEWKALDYPTRLNYAARFVEGWKAICAPHRANLTLLDEAGNEIGGRTWNGTVWVQEKHAEYAPKKRNAPNRNKQSTPAPAAPAPVSAPSAEALSDIPNQ